MDQVALIISFAKMPKGIQMHLVRNSSHCRNRPLNGASGFTLIELMIVVAVVGILAAIAYPSYNQYVLKSRRTDGRNSVLDLASREERFFSVNNAYSQSPAALGYGANPSTFPINVNVAGQSHYSINVTISNNASGFVAIATPNPSSPQSADTKCYSFKVDQTGTQSNLDSAGNPLSTTGCW